MTEQARRSIAYWIEAKMLSSEDWLFPSRVKAGTHLGTRQYARLVDKWVALVGLDPAAYGTHSMRRTKVSLLYKKTGNLRACQLLLGHTKLESTVRYLGVEVDDALELSEALDSERTRFGRFPQLPSSFSSSQGVTRLRCPRSTPTRPPISSGSRQRLRSSARVAATRER